MVARIKVGKSLSKTLNYNEQKVKQGKAECLLAANYIKDVERLSFYEKLHRFTYQAALNENSKTNSVHISLNFDPSEKLSKGQLQQIATYYMEGIGFGHQPYLVYQHEDAGHPHIHIVSTNIQASGKRIDMHNIGRNQSEKARKLIENEWNLVPAESKMRQQPSIPLRPINVQRLKYGKVETKQAITNVLDAVLNQYHYTSLPELNAILKLYNVLADRGAEGSKCYQTKGLVYRVLDEKGNKIGTPIKASAFYNKPTLAYLEKRFEIGGKQRQPHKQRLKTAIDWTLKSQPSNITVFSKVLEKEGISTILRQNPQGVIYGITFIDHQTKCVFNGSDLGKAYSAKGILEKCGQAVVLPQHQQHVSLQQATQPRQQQSQSSPEKNNNWSLHLEAIITPLQENNAIPTPFKKKRKKKKFYHL